MVHLLPLLADGGALLVLAAGTAWSATALRLHLRGTVRGAALGLLGGAALATAGLWVSHHPLLALAVFAVAALAVIGWYQSLKPRQDRDWEIDVSKGVIARIEGDIAHLDNIRDFGWTSETEAEARWTSARYDLRSLERVDAFTSIWGRPDIAHLLISFGFTDGAQIVFSVEIRRKKGEEFNEVGGFFRQFELVLIAATEEDIVKLRTTYRKEQVRLYPLRLSRSKMRRLFEAYVGLARQLEETPRFYNTLTANCTTIVWSLARSIKPDLPIDRRLILSGRMPDYLQDLGLIDPAPADIRDAAALVTPLAQTWDGTIPFSALIRQR